jgi:hypothetical protein
MPGEMEMLSEFLDTLSEKKQRNMVADVFATMRQAGEVGSLLKIEVMTRDTVRRTIGMFGEMFREQEPEMWAEAERQVLEALRRYATAAGNGNHHDNTYERVLFAEDAAQGFGFLDLMRKRFSVVLMNPPFGTPSLPSKAYIEGVYPRTKNDVYAAFVERGLELLEEGGMLGALTSRTGFFLTSFQKWREEVLLKQARPTVMADLGYGVLDTAMVETAAYCLEKVTS